MRRAGRLWSEVWENNSMQSHNIQFRNKVYQSSEKESMSDTRCTFPGQTKKHLYNICTTSAQRLRRWSNIVQMLYKCFVFAGYSSALTSYHFFTQWGPLKIWLLTEIMLPYHCFSALDLPVYFLVNRSRKQMSKTEFSHEGEWIIFSTSLLWISLTNS